MARIKYYNHDAGRWEYADQSQGSGSHSNVNQFVTGNNVGHTTTKEENNMKKILAIALAVLLIMAMAVPAYAVTPKYEFPDLPEIPDISDDAAEKIRIKIPADFWDRWFADHPIIFKLPSEELKERLKGVFD